MALIGALAFPVSASAGYPPGPFPGPEPGGAFRTIVTSAIVCADGGSLDAQYGQASITLTVPAGAFAVCTQVTVYVADAAVITPLLPAGDRLVDAFAVGWDDTISPALQPLSLTIVDGAITGAATAFQTTLAGISRLGGITAQLGRVTFTLSSPMGFAVTMPAAAPTPTASVGPGQTPPNTSTGVIAAPQATSDPTLPYLLLLGVVSAILVMTWNPRRRRRIRRDQPGARGTDE